MYRLVSFLLVCVFCLAGCQCRFYSSDIQARAKKGGIDSYTIVENLDIVEYPDKIPVVVETKEDYGHDKPGVSLLLWAFTVGLFPAIESSENTYDMTVTTPLGVQSGRCVVSSSTWFGWFPILLPYSWAGPDKEKAAKDELTRRLVSQFSKEDYAKFVKEHNDPKIVAKKKEALAKAAEEKRIAEEKRLADEKEAQRKRLINELNVEIVAPYWREKTESYLRDAKGGKVEDIKNWATPFPDEGKRIVESFGEEFMPNAFARYEKRRDKALEMQQIFNEEFPVAVSRTADTYSTYCKALERFAEARCHYVRAHVELVHFYFQHKCGIVTSDELTKIDAEPLVVRPTNLDFEYVEGWMRLKELEAKQAEFAAQFMPSSYAAYQSLVKEYEQTEKLCREIFNERSKTFAYIDETFALCVYKLDLIAREQRDLVTQYNDLCLQHKLGDKNAEELTKLDNDIAAVLKPYCDYLPMMMRSATQNPESLIAIDMVAIPNGQVKGKKSERGHWSKHGNWKTNYGNEVREWEVTYDIKSLRMQRTEVTQLEWLLIEGTTPSRYKGVSRPVENVSWDDCQSFIEKLNKCANKKYCLPDEIEWEYACRAGSCGDLGRRRNGDEGPLEKMGWCDCRSTLEVGFKEPNAWGLYDMHGNVCEWCQDKYDSSDHVLRGGCWANRASSCSASMRDVGYRYDSSCRGFRLATSYE